MKSNPVNEQAFSGPIRAPVLRVNGQSARVPGPPTRAVFRVLGWE